MAESILAAVKAFCHGCAGNQAAKGAECAAVACPLYPWRQGAGSPCNEKAADIDVKKWGARYRQEFKKRENKQ